MATSPPRVTIGLAVTRTAHYLRDVADTHQRIAVFDDEILKAERITLLIEAAQLSRTLTAPDRACRNVRAYAPHFVREIVERHVHLFESLAADEQRNLFFGQPFVFDAFDATREQVLLHAAHYRYQLVDVAGTGDQHTEHRLEIDEAANGRRLDPGREVAQVRDALLHLIECGDEIGVVVELRDDTRVLVRGVRSDLAQVVQRAQLLFDRRGDEFGHVFCCCAAPLHFDKHHRHVHRRIELRRNLMNRPESGEDHHDHREIRGHAVFGELPDHGISPHRIDGKPVYTIRASREDSRKLLNLIGASVREAGSTVRRWRISPTVGARSPTALPCRRR